MIIVPNGPNIDDNTNTEKRFTIEYTREELDKITLDFVTQINQYIARVNNRIITTLEEIEKKEEVNKIE